jgi:hypothetical protein
LEKQEKAGVGCNTEMKKDLVGRMAWESGFVKIAQNFPERGTPLCVLFTKTCSHSIHKQNTICSQFFS